MLKSLIERFMLLTLFAAAQGGVFLQWSGDQGNFLFKKANSRSRKNGFATK